MRQPFDMTEERLDLTREDVANIIKTLPKGKKKEDHVKKSLQDKGLSADEVNKVLADLDSY